MQMGPPGMRCMLIRCKGKQDDMSSLRGTSMSVSCSLLTLAACLVIIEDTHVICNYPPSLMYSSHMDSILDWGKAGAVTPPPYD